MTPSRKPDFIIPYDSKKDTDINEAWTFWLAEGVTGNTWTDRIFKLGVDGGLVYYCQYENDEWILFGSGGWSTHRSEVLSRVFFDRVADMILLGYDVDDDLKKLEIR